MPQAIPAVIAAISYVGTATTAVLAGTATLAQIATVAAVGVGAGVGSMALAKALTPQIASQGAAVQWIADPDEPLRFAFGRVGVKGSIKDAAVYGPDRMYVSFACTVSAAGPIRSFVNFRAGDYYMSFDGAGRALNEPYRDEMWFATRLGNQPDTALPLPSGLKNGASFPGWGSDRRFSGSAAYMVTLGENSKRSAYGGKIPAFVTTIEGLFCYDPRLDSTYPGGSGSCRLNDPATWVWTQNPILFALKWALGLWEGPAGNGAPQVDYQVGGIGAKVESIVLPTVVEAANIADANGWTSAAWPSTDDDKAQVLDGFLKAGGAMYAEIAGKIAFIHRAAPRSPVFTVTARDTAGPVEIDTASSKLNRINTLRPRYWSEAHEWEMTALPEVTSTAWQIEDGQGVAVKRTRGADYSFVPQPKQARELASLEISHSREGIRGRVPLRPYMDPEPGNCFIFDEPDFALSEVKCFVLNVEDDTDNDTVIVTFETETDGKYPFAYGQTGNPPPAQELSPVDPREVNPPNPLDWTVIVRPPAPEGGGQLPGFLLQGVVNNATAHRVLVETGPTEDGPWTQAYFGPPTAETIEITVDANTTYFIAVSYFNAAGNQSARTVYGPYDTNPLIAGGLTGFESLQPLLDAIEVTRALGEALGQDAGARILELLGGQDLAAQSIFGLAADIEARQRYTRELGFIEGERVGTYAQRRTTELFTGQTALVEDISLIGARTEDGLGWLLRGDTVKIGEGQTLVGALVQLQAQTSETAASVVELTEVTAGQAAASAYQLSLLGAQVPGQSIFRLTETSVEVGSRGAIGSILNSLIATDGSNASSISSLLSVTSDQASSLSSLTSTVGGYSASISSLFTAQAGLGARWTMAIDVDGAMTALVADGATRSILFKAASLTILDDGNGLSYTPATGRLKIVKGSQKTVLGAGGSLVLWAGPTSISDGGETVDNGILGIGAGDSWFGGRTLSVPFGADAPGSAVALSTAYASVAQGEKTTRNGFFIFQVSIEAFADGTPDAEGFRSWGVDLQIISVAWDFSEQETLWSDSFGGAWGPGAPVEWVGHTSAINLNSASAGTRSGRRRIILQARAASGTTATVRSGNFRALYYL